MHLGRYTLRHPVGRGGSATVWAARHSLLGTTHAIKLLDEATPRRVARLQHEGRVQSTLDPQVVVPVTDVITEGSRVGLVMPLVQGCSLAELLEVHRPTPAEVFALVEAVLSGIEVAHRADVVHCDLKPANVLLDVHLGRVRARVADFGIAYSSERQVARHGFEGTPAYASPEQLEGSDTVDARSDLFALGCVLVELLGGTRRSAQGLDPQWSTVAAALLAPSASDRPASAQQVRELLPQDLADARVLRVGQPLARAVRRLQARAAEPDSPATVQGTLVTWSNADDEALPEGNLPPDGGALFGRSDDVARVIRLLRTTGEPVWLVGPAGMGKTALAVSVAREQRVERSGGVWFVSLARAASLQDAVEAVSRVLGVVSGGEVEPLAEAVRARGRCLLVLDDVGADPGGLLQALQARAPQARLILTSRVHPSAGQVVPVQPLSVDDGVALLQARRQAHVAPARAAELVARLDGVPLAIELVAARDDLHAGEADVEADLAEALRGSWRPLSRQDKRLLARLSVLEGPFDEAVARALWPQGTPVLERLHGLVHRSLVRPEGQGWFRLLAGVRELARTQLDALGVDLLAVREALARYLARFGATEALDDLAGPGGTERRRELGRHVDDLIACTRWATAYLDAPTAASLALVTARVLVRDGPVGQVPALIQAVCAREHVPDPARVHLELSRALAESILGDDEARVQALSRAESLAERLHDPALQARVLLQQSNRALRHLDHSSVRALADRALGLSDEVRTRAIAAMQLGYSAAYAGRVEQALQHLRRAVTLAEDVGDAALLGRSQGNLANILSEAGHEDEALTHYESALLTLNRAGELRMAAITRSSLGLLLRQRGDLQAAARTLNEALQEHLRVGNRRSAAISLLHRGTTLCLAGDLDAALQSLVEAEERLRDLGNELLAADARGHQGLLRRERGEHDRAESLLRSALATHQDGAYPEAEATWLRELAWIHAERGQPWRDLIERSLSTTSTPSGAAETHAVHADLALQDGHLDQARTAVDAALSQEPHGIVRALVLGALARVLDAEDRPTEAQDARAEARDLAERAGIGPGSPVWGRVG